MSPHEAAQSVAWFAIAMFILIGLVIANDIRKEMKWATNRK
jgi:hypothetical protein